MSSTITLPPGFAFTQTVHNAPYHAIAPSRPELSQAGKTVLITGGHTGIGYAIARAFAQASAKRLIIIGRRDNLVASAATRLASEFPSTQTVGLRCDIADAESVDRLWNGLANDNTFVDVVVLNAAKLSPQPILDLGRDKVWEEYIINVWAHLDFTERLYKQPGAKVRQKALINLASLAIHESKLTGQYPSYAATKSAGTMLVQQIAKDVPPEELQIVSYHPGGVFTELAELAGFEKDDPRWDDESADADAENLPGQFAVWAASPEARFLHGRFVWAKWDVTELLNGPLRKRIDEDDSFLKVGVVGIEEWEQSQRGKKAPRQDPVSCESCRRKKLKCNRQRPCSSCVTRRLSCSYGISLERIEPAIVEVENASHTNTAPSQGIRGQPREAGDIIAPSITDPRPMRTSNESVKTADWLENIVMSDRVPTVVSRHLQDEISQSEAAHDPSGDNGDSRLGEVVPNFFRHRLASSENPMTVDLASYLPEMSRTMALFRYYCQYIDYLYHVIIPSRVEDQINRIYHCIEKGIPVDLAHVVLLFSILASSVYFQYSNGISTFAEKCSREFIFLTGAALIRSNYIACPTLEGLQASLIVMHYLPNPSFHSSVCALFLHGTIIGQAKSLMLHCTDSSPSREEREAHGFDALELELKRRLWWDIASFDWLLGFLSGPQEWTYLINPQLMNVRKPLNIDDEDIQGRAAATPSPISEPTQMSYTLQRLNLAVVCREIVDMTAYEHMHGIDVGYHKILELDRKLHQAYNNLPDFYRLDTVSRRRFAALYRSRPRCLLQQAYHSRFCRLHRLYFIRGAREPAYSYSHVICLQSARKVLEIKRIMDEDEPKFMPPTSTVWSVMHHVFMAAVILLMDVCFNWDDLLADKRKQEVLDACRMLSQAQRTSSLVSQGIQAMMDVLQKHWKSAKHSSADGQPSNLPSSPALGATAVAEPAQLVSYRDSANATDTKGSPADPSFLNDQNESHERPLEDIWTEMLDSGGDLNFATPDWTDLLTELTNATLPSPFWAMITEGESVFISHSQIPEYIPSKPISDDGDIALLYATVSNPVSVDDEADVQAYDEYLHTSPGLTTSLGTVLRTIDLRPGKMSPMHRTVSVDYGVVLEGEVDLILDSGQSRTLRRGDKLTIKGRDLDQEVYDEHYDHDSGSEDESQAKSS
ncbi:transcription factor domain-containing protein [Aspergillus novofumigatus IBT 16806]|uniref:Zn(2)-C6 fungal-type domain-containing protein n=1 Tax=Aspergillus novofumigatus (strain IBT 16806) TaxID=1392255 RepID=A0A2I1BVL3_ASPN1|nr:uncharacterized protein P174DRAFT_507712 [Aspergillus novofumigatus IBT 16806]PKX89433.1 hypothetical protein P174DRAFT_507712 [Aspergillus novofumigatus IBT 16806]